MWAKCSAELHTAQSQFPSTRFWRSAASGVQLGRQESSSERPPLPAPGLLRSPRALAAAGTAEGEGGDLPALKHRNCFLAITLPPRINFSFLSLEAQHCFYLFGICGDKTSFILISHTGNAPSEQLICLWQQETANQVPNFSNKR